MLGKTTRRKTFLETSLVQRKQANETFWKRLFFRRSFRQRKRSGQRSENNITRSRWTRRIGHDETTGLGRNSSLGDSNRRSRKSLLSRKFDEKLQTFFFWCFNSSCIQKNGSKRRNSVRSSWRKLKVDRKNRRSSSKIVLGERNFVLLRCRIQVAKIAANEPVQDQMISPEHRFDGSFPLFSYNILGSINEYAAERSEIEPEQIQRLENGNETSDDVPQLTNFRKKSRIDGGARSLDQWRYRMQERQQVMKNMSSKSLNFVFIESPFLRSIQSDFTAFRILCWWIKPIVGENERKF